jgi:N,N'-diacetyllegionaminate synthase
MRKTLIIAEAGVNHNGDMSIAKDLIDTAAEAGADIVKFQTFKAVNLASKRASLSEYQKKNSKLNQQFEMLKALELSFDDHIVLANHCKKREIEFLSTAFDMASLEFLSQMELKRFKIPSGEITNLPYIRKIGSFGLPVILSTGMATLGEVEQAIIALDKMGLSRKLVTTLHCTTEYPTPIMDVNLTAMITLGSCFRTKYGYSDHTIGTTIPIAAVALGADIVEKHFTLDRNMPGPDHSASLEFKELREMVNKIRDVELSLGDGIKKVMSSEMENRVNARKSIVAAEEIRKGEKFTCENITAKRPGTGMSPMRWDDVIGAVARMDFAVDDEILL